MFIQISLVKIKYSSLIWEGVEVKIGTKKEFDRQLFVSETLTN